MSDLNHFRDEVSRYCSQSLITDSRESRRATLADLALRIPLAREELSRLLHGRGYSKLQDRHIRRIILALVEMGGITYRSEARHLLGLMDVPDFTPGAWAVHPLNMLKDDRATVTSSNATTSRPDTVVQNKNDNNIIAGKGSFLWPPAIPNEHYHRLPGRERNLNQLLATLQNLNSPSIIVIDGLGGLGKTALAAELARSAIEQGLFDGVVGDSAQQELFASDEIFHVRETTLNFDLLLNSIARQLGHWELPTLKEGEKRTILANLLQQNRYLIFVDNLETAENANTLIAHLHAFLGKGRAVITSRKKVRHDFVQSLSLRGLAQEDSLFFLQKDIESRKVQQLQNATKEKLIEIHQVTGGAPLAMKLVVAQATFLDLNVILKQLQQASSNLYSFIFRQSWQHLTPVAQKILIYIGKTVVTTVRWKELVDIRIAANEEQLIQAIDQLVSYSLVDAISTNNQIRYGIHQLTRQFINGELPTIWRQQGLL